MGLGWLGLGVLVHGGTKLKSLTSIDAMSGYQIPHPWFEITNTRTAQYSCWSIALSFLHFSAIIRALLLFELQTGFQLAVVCYSCWCCCCEMLRVAAADILLLQKNLAFFCRLSTELVVGNQKAPILIFKKSWNSGLEFYTTALARLSLPMEPLESRDCPWGTVPSWPYAVCTPCLYCTVGSFFSQYIIT